MTTGLSSHQKYILQKFQEAVSDIKKPSDNDMYLLQWLIARDYNLNEAEIMIRTSMKWRESIGADHILETWEPPEVVHKYFPRGRIGLDKESCPLWILPTGYLDIKGMMRSVTSDALMRSTVFYIEEGMQVAAKQSQNLGRYIYQHSVILDLEGITFSNAFYTPGISLFTNINRIQEDNYPETLKILILINVPRFCTFVLNIIKQFMSEKTRNKIVVFDSNRSKWVPALLELVDHDQLPTHWGGTMVDADGDPKCSSKIAMGGEVPKSYYITDKLEDSDSVEIVTIKRRDKLHLDFKVVQSFSRIRWRFQTRSQDIAFGIFRADLGERKEVLPLKRVESSKFIIEGESIPLDCGIYVVTFDNSYSKIRSKSLCYTVQVVPPNSESQNSAQATNSTNIGNK